MDIGTTPVKEMPPLYEPIYLEVPTEHVNCCPCPEHWENYIGDAAAWLDRRNFYYWVNESKIYGDYIVPERKYTVRNTSDFAVNGTFDLVNLFPVALDLSSFTNAWQNRVTYTVKPRWGYVDSFNFCFTDVPWSRAGSIQTTNVTTTVGQALASAS